MHRQLSQKRHTFLLIVESVLEILESYSCDARNTNTTNKPKGVQAFIWKPEIPQGVVHVAAGIPTESVEFSTIANAHSDDTNIPILSINDNEGKAQVCVSVVDLLQNENYAVGIILLSYIQSIPVSSVIEKLRVESKIMPECLSDPKHYLGKILVANEDHYHHYFVHF